jgi:hypothetical protein
MEMNKLSKRTKMFLGIGGLVVVLAVVVVLAFSQLGGDLLFGSGVTVSPSTLTIAVGSTGQLTSSHSKVICKWSSSNSNIVKITSSSDHTANLQGVAAGSATITEKCGAAGRYTGSAVVTVIQPTVTLINATGLSFLSMFLEAPGGGVISVCSQSQCTFNIQYGQSYQVSSQYSIIPDLPRSAKGCPVGDFYFEGMDLAFIYCPVFTVGAANYTVTFQ